MNISTCLYYLLNDTNAALPQRRNAAAFVWNSKHDRTSPPNQGCGFGTPVPLFMRQDFGLWFPFVASIPLRRNNSMKILPKYLEIAKTRRTFASTKQS